MLKSVAFLVATGLIATSVNAIPISVGTSGSPLVMDAGTTAGGVTVNVFNASTPDTPGNFLAAWTTSLIIVPDGGSTGTVGFASAGAAASDYVFGTPSILFTTVISTDTTTDDSLLGFDSQFPPAGGVEIPTTGLNLMDLSFNASGDADGTFGIFLLPSPDSTWGNAGDAGTPVDDQDFGNFAAANVPVRIGEIQVNPVVVDVAVPEPVTSALGMMGLAVLGSVLTRRR